jgi:hypothetical protein
MRCGTTTVTETLWDEPHPHVVRTLGYKLVAVEPDVLAWLAAWPRLATSELNHEVFLTATERAENVAALATLERAASAAQQPWSYRERLRRCRVPKAAPPASLSELPNGSVVLSPSSPFVALWSALQLTDETPLATVLAHAGRGWGARIADEILVRRPALADEVAPLLLDGDPKRRDVGYAIVERHRLASDDMLATLGVRLADPTLEQQELHLALTALVALGASAAPLAGVLDVVAKRFANDYYLHKRIVDVTRMLTS